MAQKASFKNKTLRHSASLIFAVSSILPLLLFLLVLERYNLIKETEVVLLLGLSLLISGLGYLFFRQIVKQIGLMAEDFLKIKEGKLDQVIIREAPQEISEMARIADGFNKILNGFKDNTRELENLIYKLSTLSELTELVSRIPDIKDVLKTILNRIMITVNAKCGSIMLLDPEKQILTIEAAEGLEDEIVAKTFLTMGEGIAGKIAQSGQPVLVENLEKDSRFARPNNPKYETPSFISMPLKIYDRVIGVLNLSKKENRTDFSESDFRFLTTALHHISFAVDNARLLKEAKEAALHLQEAFKEKNIELNSAQQKLIQAAKLGVLNEVVSALAFTLKKPHLTVLGYAEPLLSKIRDKEIKEDLKKIVDESLYGTAIIRDLLPFAKRKTPEKKLCDVNQILSNILELCAPDLSEHDTNVITKLSPYLPKIMADERQITQAFLNIINNAGQVLLSREKPRNLHIETSLDQKQTRIKFTDNGPIINPENLDHIFDPFFTIKGREQSAGLELSISYSIVKAHEGDIYVESHEGQGNTFIIDLPGFQEKND